MIVIVNICKMDHDISLVRILFKKNWDIFREIIFKIKILFWAKRREIGKILLSTIFLLWKNDGQIKYTILYSYIYKWRNMILSDLIRSRKYCNPFEIEATKHHEKKKIQ